MFSRQTLVAILDVLWQRISSNAQFDELLFVLVLDDGDLAPGVGGLEKRKMALLRRLAVPDALGPRGSPLVMEFAEEVFNRCGLTTMAREDLEYAHPGLVNSLRQDGFELAANAQLLRHHPDVVDLAPADNEVHALLKKLGMSIAVGHLDQALAAHARGEWASANAQLRSTVEAMFDSVAVTLAPDQAEEAEDSIARRELLAGLDPPFLQPKLNEWEVGKSGGFVQGFYKRLHPGGSHPGLSDEEDATFRVQLVLVVMRHFLRRLERRLSS